MKKIAISLDSACDLSKELIEKYDFKIIRSIAEIY